MPDVKITPGQAQDIPWQDAQYPFDGEWMPDVDPALIGPRNFANLVNLRYNDRSIEGVNGYTLVNEDTALSTYTKIRDGHQLRSDKTQKSYILASAHDDSNPGRVYIHTSAFAAKGDFVTAENIDPSGKPSSKVPYITDSSASLIPQFSNAPQNSVVYCNGEDTKIFSGYEHRIAAAFLCNTPDGQGIIDSTEDINNKLSTRTIPLAANLATDGDMESDPTTNWAQKDTSTVTAETGAGNYKNGSQSVKIVTHAATGDEDGIVSNAAFTVTAQDYWLGFWVKSDSTTVKYALLDGDDGVIHADGIQSATVVANEWTYITYEVTMTAGSSAKIQIMGAGNSETLYVDDVSFVPDGEYPELHLLTTRPVQGFKFYIQTANATASSLDVEYWNGSSFADVNDDDDDTAAGGATLAQTGFYRFAHTNGRWNWSG
jgi:hypothetical protein